MLADLRYALRRLHKSPGFVVAAVLILSFAIGANSVHFTITNTLLFRPVPGVPAAQALLRIGETYDKGGFRSISYQDYLAYREAKSLSGLAAGAYSSINVGPAGAVERVDGAVVTSNHFTLLGVRPAIGRVFERDEDRIQGQPAIAVISSALWKRRFGARPGIAGETIRLNGRPYTIIGVAPEAFRGIEVFEKTDVWVPLSMYEHFAVGFRGTRVMEDGNAHVLAALGRLKPGVPMAAAKAELDTIAARLESRHEREFRGLRAAVTGHITMDPDWRKDVIQLVGIELALAALLLVVACANIANLLLSRAAARQKEVGVRLALGATRWHLFRELLIEAGILAALGAVGALCLAIWTSDLVVSLAGAVPFETTVDVRVFLLTLSIAGATAVVLSLIPGAEAGRSDLADSIKGENTKRAAGSRLRDALVVAQVALSLAALVVSGLFLRTLKNYETAAQRIPNLLLAPVDLRSPGYPDDRVRSYVRQLTERVERVPGVRSATVASSPPSTGWVWTEHIAAAGRDLTVGKNNVGLKYFATLDIPIVRGRDFTLNDRAGAPRVAIVNETFARQIWPGEDPVGRYFDSVFIMLRTPIQIVGVAKDVPAGNPGDPVRPWLYYPILQSGDTNFQLHARTSVPANSIRAAVLREAQSVDPEVPVSEIRTHEEHMRELLGEQRFRAIASGIGGALALAITITGLYGVVACSVSRRMREFGVRMALGASPADIVTLVLRRGAALAAAGIVLGTALSMAATRLLQGVLYRVRPDDPSTYIAVAAVLLAVSLLASYLPARRAAQVEAATVLRSE